MDKIQAILTKKDFLFKLKGFNKLLETKPYKSKADDL